MIYAQSLVLRACSMFMVVLQYDNIISDDFMLYEEDKKLKLNKNHENGKKNEANLF